MKEDRIWTIESTKVDGKTKSIYLVFGKPDRAEETMRWTRDGGRGHLLIDVGLLDLPIAMQVVDSFMEDEEANKVVESGEFDSEKVVRELFAFANRMIAFRRASEDAMSKPLIEESADRVHRLERSRGHCDLQTA